MRMRKVQQRFFTSPHLLRSPPHLTSLYFFAQIGNASWTPNEIHDEYWHPHVDKENTAHYDYSALLYLADSNLDFTGGEFRWIDDAEAAPDATQTRGVAFHSMMDPDSEDDSESDITQLHRGSSDDERSQEE